MNALLTADRATELFNKGFQMGQKTDMLGRTVRNTVRIKNLLWAMNDDLVNWELDQMVFGFQQGYRLRIQEKAAE